MVVEDRRCCSEFHFAAKSRPAPSPVNLLEGHCEPLRLSGDPCTALDKLQKKIPYRPIDLYQLTTITTAALHNFTANAQSRSVTMGYARTGGGPSLTNKTSNKLRRKDLYVQNKKAANKERHEERHRRRREENKDPKLREERLANNKTITIEKKRIWDEGDDDSLGAQVDLAALKRRRLEEAEAAEEAGEDMEEDDEEDEDLDSMLGSDEEEDEDDEDKKDKAQRKRAQRQPSAVPSLAPSTTSTNLDLTPDSLARQFTNLFSDEVPPMPKILVTTSLNATIHKEAQEIAAVLPNSEYIRRSGHRWGHKYSVREIAKYAKNRGFTALVVVHENLKKPYALSVVHLNSEDAPPGPTLTYSVRNYLPGKSLLGHGNATNHYPELLLNNFQTPLGLLAAKSMETIFPHRPEIQGRQVVTLHNQRDYIFFRRHRYVFREAKGNEKNVVTAEGSEMKGMQGIRAGLQEIGPSKFSFPHRLT